ncbi:MAG: GNAT family N-acetyltransferase [Candidatus Bathyarchaeia archaeon]
MFLVRKMSTDDLDFAVRLTDTKNWGLTKEDFLFMMELEPDGCFTLLEGSEKVGIVTSINYGRIGWFGNLIVEKKHRRKGAASLLVKQVINYLMGKGAETVGLYSYMDAVTFYRRLGFGSDEEFTVIEGKARKSESESFDVKRVEGKEDLEKIIEYDISCLNILRRKLLEAIFRKPENLCYFSVENGEICGYIMAKVYEGFAEIGPLICNRESTVAALNLIEAVLNMVEGSHVTLCLPKKEISIRNFLNERGFSESFDVVRMFFKPISIKDYIYIAESLERG